MKVTIDLENLQGILESTLNENCENAISDTLQQVVREKVDRTIKSSSDAAINSAVERYINEYLSETKIRVGNEWSGDGVKEYTIEEYLKKSISEIFDSKVLTVKEKDRWGSTFEKKVGFRDYIESKTDVEHAIKPHLDKLAKSIRDDVNCKIKSMFDEAMRTTLADNVFQIVASSETYQKVKGSLSLLGE